MLISEFVAFMQIMLRFTGLPQFSTKRRVWHMLPPKVRLKKFCISPQNIFVKEWHNQLVLGSLITYSVHQCSYSLLQMPQVWTDPLCSNFVWHHGGPRDHRALQVIWLWTCTAPHFHVTSENAPTTATTWRLNLFNQVSLGLGPRLVPRWLGATSEECKRTS